MKITKILVAACALTLAGCQLDYDEVTGYTDTDRIFEGFENTRRYVTDIYGSMRSTAGFNSSMGGGFLASATDEAEYAVTFSNIHYFYNGAWSRFFPMMNWTTQYGAIRAVNIFLVESEGRTFDEFKENSDYITEMRRFENYKWEVRFLRAWFYFDLARKFGDVPFVGDRILTEEEVNSFSRMPVQDIFDYVIHECEVVAEELPDEYTESGVNDRGRATKSMALALRARAALYAASPLFNKEDDKTLWLRSAMANKDVIDHMTVTRGIMLTNSYTSIWDVDNYKIPQNIMWVVDGENNWLESSNFPAGIEGGYGGNCPTQNLVDAYQMTNGKFWDAPGSGYDPQAPWDNRDPRLGMTIAKNGDTGWPGYLSGKLETFEGGAHGEPLSNATPTGYYLKKWLNSSVDLRPNSTTTTWHTFVVFRLAEFYLNYAESVYRYLGTPDAMVGDLPMSAVGAINVVRSRPGVGMPALAAGMDDQTFWKYYESERMVELAFEDHRFYDVRRWKLGAERFKQIHEMKIVKTGDNAFTYTRRTVNRNWEEKMNLFPISEQEIRLNPNLTQNQGW